MKPASRVHHEEIDTKLCALERFPMQIIARTDNNPVQNSGPVSSISTFCQKTANIKIVFPVAQRKSIVSLGALTARVFIDTPRFVFEHKSMNKNFCFFFLLSNLCEYDLDKFVFILSFQTAWSLKKQKF